MDPRASLRETYFVFFFCCFLSPLTFECPSTPLPPPGSKTVRQRIPNSQPNLSPAAAVELHHSSAAREACNFFILIFFYPFFSLTQRFRPTLSPTTSMETQRFSKLWLPVSRTSSGALREPHTSPLLDGANPVFLFFFLRDSPIASCAAHIMASKGPQAAFVEEFDEDSNVTLPGTRLSANIAPNTAAKLSRLDPRHPEPLIDGASDSGYSSRTAATTNSTQSGPSGGKSPPAPLKVDNPRRTDLNRKSSTRERRDKERSRPSREEKMVGAYAGAAHHAHVHRSSSKPHGRDSAPRQYHDSYYEYHSYRPAPVENRQGEYPFHVESRPPVPDFSSSPHAPRYGAIESVHVNNPGRSNRSHAYHSYHPNNHAIGFHGVQHGMGSGMTSGMTSPMYSQSSVHGYDHGPPLSNSAYMQNQYSSSPYGQSSFYAPSEYGAPSEYRERSLSREPSRRRSNSIYAAPPQAIDSGAYSPWYDDDQPLERYSSREARGRPSISHQDPDEEYYRGSMGPPVPPPAPPMPRPKTRAIPQVHQDRRAERPERPEPRKAHTSGPTAPSQRLVSRGMDRDRGADYDYDRMDMADLRDALPVVSDRGNRRVSRDTPLERTRSIRDVRRSVSYADERRSAQVAVASSRRRKPTEYYEPSSTADDLEDLERGVESYQAARSGRASTAALPLSQEVLPPSKTSNRNGSDSGSQKSRSNSSRGSGTASRTEEDKNMTLTLNGLKIGFTQENMAGKSINIRAGDTGGLRLNIGGGPRHPKQYVNGSGSDYTGGASRRELEDVRRPIEDVRRARDERRSERGTRRGSQSAYMGRYHH
ncbi:unnamed protein product [Penicillium salamii]|uniref:Uncharacterized protein n=1 Tax=Penicillium salamii TaxID=1612424 RepID=A0A9W4NES5_9EURO|nr:unnamed protein product [Penicillium salamii]CAG8057562.1 unnamed protein product [Penicillium salamii]CAG8111776.1 unnamed protein product [Penicillium salamii]CAG8177964.1 unnamed protein product [Penicillium salamii]CAG8264370.1 unnamed protein product [Penicillium salamii]